MADGVEMTLNELGLTESLSLRKKAHWARRQGYGETAALFDRLAGILERAEEVRDDATNGVVDYILNGGDRMEGETHDGVMRDFNRLRNLVDERMALGAIAFTDRAGRWSATRDRTPLPYKDVLSAKSAAYTRAGQYLAEGMTHFTVIEGPWTISLSEETVRP